MNRASSADPPISLPEVRSLAVERNWHRLAERVSAVEGFDWTGEWEILFHYADSLWRLGDPGKAMGVIDMIEPEVRQSGDRHLLLNLINVAGMALFEAGRMDEAEDRFGELLDQATTLGDHDFSARASNNLGVIANVRGRRDQALVCYQRAMVAYQKLGSVRGLAQTNHNLGICYRDLNFEAEADHHFERAISLASSDGSGDVVAMAETERAMLRVHWGDSRLAIALAERAIQSFEEMSDPLGRADAVRVLAAAARAGHDYEAAARYLQEALTTAEEHANPLLIAEVQQDRGLLLADSGDSEGAREAFLTSASQFRTLNATDEAARMEALAHALATT